MGTIELLLANAVTTILEDDRKKSRANEAPRLGGRSMISLGTRLLLIAVCPTVLNAADAPNPALKLISSTVQVTSTDPANADVFVQAENFPKNSIGKGHPEVQDLAVLPAPPVQIGITFQREVSQSETGAIWLYKLVVSGLPRQSSVPRKMSLSLDKRLFTVDYALTDKPPATFTWSFLAPPVWNLVDSSVAEIPVVVKEVQATGIRLLQSTLTRQNGRAIWLGTQDLELCLNKDGDCQAPDAIGPSDSRSLYLRMKGAANGSYSGNIVIRCDQKPEGDTIAVTANVTTTGAQGLGAGAVATGVFAYFLVVVVARRQLAKNSRKELALLLLEQVQELKKHAMLTVAKAPEWARVKTAQAFDGLASRLADTSLRPYMPELLNTDAKMDDFNAYLQSVGLQLDSLNIVVELGMSKIEQAWSVAGADANKQASVKSAVDDLLAIPDGKITASDSKPKVDGILAKMNTAIGAAPAAGLNLSDVQLRLQHVWLATAGWTWLVLLIWIGVTLLTGVMAMVITKPGFGTAVDYALCILWGFGLPAAGTQLNQLSASGIGSKLGITIPKAEA